MSVIKIDKAFIQPLPAGEGARHIVDATISLSHRLGKGVVSEGIESNEALELVRDMGCDLAQGYHIGRPVPADDFLSWYGDCRGMFSISTAACPKSRH